MPEFWWFDTKAWIRWRLFGWIPARCLDCGKRKRDVAGGAYCESCWENIRYEDQRAAYYD